MTIREYQGHKPVLGEGCYVDASALVLGDVTLGDDCSVWPMAVIRGDMHRIRIGARCSIQDNSVLHITHAGPYNPDGFPLQIGDDVTMGHRVVLHGCTLGSRILVGMGAVVMDGAIVEDHVIIGAGTLVPPGKRLRSGHLYTGQPAREIRPLKPREAEFFTYTADNYVRLKDRYLKEYGNSV